MVFDIYQTQNTQGHLPAYQLDKAKFA